jgi:hypothetical protein
LTNQISSNNKHLSFDVNSAEIIDQNDSSQFITAKVNCFSSGETRNNTTCDPEDLKRCASTIFLTPILFTVDKSTQDFYTHVSSDHNLISGVILPNSATFDDQDGKTTLTVIAKIWRRYSENFVRIFRQDNTMQKKVSVEVELIDAENQPNGLLKMKDWIFQGICVLGDTVTEAVRGSNIQLLSFAEENDEFKQAYELEFGKYDSLDLSVPKGVKESAQKGLDLYKQYNRGGTGTALAAARHFVKSDKATPEKIKYVYKYHESHKNVEKDDKNFSDSYIAFLLHGGQDGYSWSKELSAKFQELDEKHLSYFGLEVTFPYDKLSDANPAIRGIDPPVSLAQANAIARQADAVGSDKEKNGWAIAISSFKKTHKVVDGKWVEKEKNMDLNESEKEEMSVKDEKEIKEENMAKEETPEEEKTETPEKEKQEEGKEKKENPEEEKTEKPADEKKEEDKEKKMSLDSNVDLAFLLKLLEDETEDRKAFIGEEFAKPEGERNYAVICNSMYAKMCKMAAEHEEMSAKMATMAADAEKAKNDNQAYMDENMSLKEFKANIEKTQFSAKVESVLAEVIDTLTQDEIDTARKESVNYSIANINGWENSVKAIAFSHTKGKKSKPEYTIIGLPFARPDYKQNDSPWKRQ